MTRVMLFCIAEEAKSSIPKILSVPDHPFSLVESRDCSSDGKDMKTKLSDNDAFETAFVGSSEQDCEDWFFGKQNVVNYMEFNIIGIADARTAKDGTISMRWYQDGEGVERPPYGVLPPEPNSWYEFRTEPEGAARLLADLNFVEPDVIHRRYFGRTEEFTDKNGVFDLTKVEEDIRGK